MTRIQYTLRGVPADVDAELRREARASGKPLNVVAIAALEQATRPAGPAEHDDLDWFVGSAPPTRAERAGQEWLDELPAELE